MKENHPYQGSKVEKKSLGDLFDDDLYLLCVISIFAIFEIEGCLRSWQLPKQLRFLV